MDIKEIQSLIKFVAKSGASEVKLETDDIKITIRTGPSGSGSETTYVQQIPVPAQPVAPAAPQQPAPAAPQPAGGSLRGQGRLGWRAPMCACISSATSCVIVIIDVGCVR